ncbi:MAG: hypothetical protein ACRDCY_07925 [Aeromonas veronii]
MRMSDGKYQQSTPSMEWSFTIPDGRASVELFGVYSADLKTLIPHDSYDIVNGVMTIYFSASTGAVSGVARYEYDIDGGNSNPSTVTGCGGTINVVQNNYPKA